MNSDSKWPTIYPTGPGFGAPTLPVVMRTTRHRESVCYEVRVGDTKAQEAVVWIIEVYFGMTDDTVAGGDVFVRTAREQQRIADEWAAAIVRSQK